MYLLENMNLPYTHKPSIQCWVSVGILIIMGVECIMAKSYLKNLLLTLVISRILIAYMFVKVYL